MILPQDKDEPKDFKEVISYPNKEKLIKAMEEEMESMITNQVWELVYLPKGRKAHWEQMGSQNQTQD